MKLKRKFFDYCVVLWILGLTCTTVYLNMKLDPPIITNIGLDTIHKNKHLRQSLTELENLEPEKVLTELENLEPEKVLTELENLEPEKVLTELENLEPEKVLTELENLEPEKIAVAIPTYNRIGYVQLTSSTLRGTFPSRDIWVFDDGSNEYTYKDLIQMYSTKHVFVTKKHLNADAMARHILEWFLSTDYDVLVLLDSDLLVAPNWVQSLRQGLEHSKGLLSLYRSGAPKHITKNCQQYLCKMPSMGNAGTVWTRALTEKMLSEMPNHDGGFDWGWSEWCQKNAVPMEALKESAVLHIGMHGSWSHETSAEKSVGFPMQTLSAEVRQQVEHFLRGAKPQQIVKSKQIEHDSSLQAVQKPIKKHVAKQVAIKRPNDILWVIPAFKRAWSLDLVLKSLVGKKILVSKDADSAEIDSVLTKYSVNVINHPYSCSQHPNRFPAKDDTLNENYKGDTYGNPRSPWATCLKHHWWWMMKQAWARKPKRVCVLEDDTVIHPQAFEWIAGKEGNIKLTPEEIAVPWCMSA